MFLKVFEFVVLFVLITTIKLLMMWVLGFRDAKKLLSVFLASLVSFTAVYLYGELLLGPNALVQLIAYWVIGVSIDAVIISALNKGISRMRIFVLALTAGTISGILGSLIFGAIAVFIEGTWK